MTEVLCNMHEPISGKDVEAYLKTVRKYGCLVCGSTEFIFFKEPGINAAILVESDENLENNRIEGGKAFIYMPYECKLCHHCYFVTKKAIIEWKHENAR